MLSRLRADGVAHSGAGGVWRVRTGCDVSGAAVALVLMASGASTCERQPSPARALRGYGHSRGVCVRRGTAYALTIARCELLTSGTLYTARAAHVCTLCIVNVGVHCCPPVIFLTVCRARGDAAR